MPLPRIPAWRFALLGGLLLGWFLHAGLIHKPHLARDAQAIARAEQAVGRINAANQKVATEARNLRDRKQEAIRVVTRNTIEKVKVYVPAGQGLVAGGALPVAEVGEGGPRGAGVLSDSGDAHLYLPLGFGRLHDYAALGIDPPAPSPADRPLGTSSGVGLPELATTIAGNYGVCLADRADLEAWKGWYRELEKGWPR